MKAIASSILFAFLANSQAPEPLPGALPVEPQVAPLPAEPAPVATAAPVRPHYNTLTPPAILPPGLSIDHAGVQCEMNACANAIIDVVPSQGWKFDCKGNCARLELNIDIGFDPLHPGMVVDYIDAITFTGPHSGAGATINFFNTLADSLTTHTVHINDFRCEAVGSCNDIWINGYHGVDLHSINADCQVEQASCLRCAVRTETLLESCDQNQNPNGWALNPYEYTLPLVYDPARPSNNNPMLPAYTVKNPSAAVPNHNAPLPVEPVAVEPVAVEPVTPVAPEPIPQVEPQQPQTQPQQPQYPYPYPYPYPYYPGYPQYPYPQYPAPQFP